MKAIKVFILRHKIIVVVLILLISIFLRFNKVQDLFVFTGDEEHQLSIAQTIVNNFHIEWVGVSSADTEFYLGPFWEYFGALWLYISRGDPAIVAYVASLIGVVTTLLVYVAGRVLFGNVTAIIASFLYATLPLIVYYDRKFWNPALTSFASLALFASLYKTKDSPGWWILVAFIYGMVFHIHLSLVPLGLVILYWFWKKKSKVSMNIILACAVIFFVTISPLIGFEYFHKFSNLKTPIRVFNMVKNTPSRIDPVGHTEQLFKSLGRIWYLYPYRSNSDEVVHGCSLDYTNGKLHKPGITTTTSGNIFIFSLLSFVLLFCFLIKPSTWKEKNTRLLELFIITIAISYIVLPNVPLEYYLLGIFPLFLFLPGLVSQSFGSLIKKGFVLFIILIAFLGAFTVLTASDLYGLSVKRRLIERTVNYMGDKKYELKADGLCHLYEGWRFLFKAYAKKPERSYSDDNLGWLYPDEITNDKADYRVLVTEMRIQKEVSSGYETVITEGGFNVYIYPLK